MQVLFKEALRIKELKLGHESHLVAGATVNLAGCYRKQNRFDECEPLLKEAMRIWEALGNKQQDYAQALNSLGTM